MHNKNAKIYIIIGLIVVLAIVLIFVVKGNRTAQLPEPETATPSVPTTSYTYKNHGITLNLPGYTLTEERSETGPAYIINLPGGVLTYVTDATWWEQNVIPSYTYVNAQAVGSNVYRVYSYSGKTFYWMKQGNVGYEYSGDTKSINSLKFVGWAQE